MHCGNSHFCLACKEKVEQGARCQTFTKGKPVNKSQLIDALAARYEGNKKAAAHALESVLDTITREVAKGEKVAITGFGSFEKRVREARWVRNPATGQRMKSKRTPVPKFSAGAELKAIVSGAKKLPSCRRGRSRRREQDRRCCQEDRDEVGVGGEEVGRQEDHGEEVAPAKKATAKKTAAKKTAAKKAPAKKAAAKKTRRQEGAGEEDARPRRPPAQEDGRPRRPPPRRRRPKKARGQEDGRQEDAAKKTAKKAAKRS